METRWTRQRESSKLRGLDYDKMMMLSDLHIKKKRYKKRLRIDFYFFYLFFIFEKKKKKKSKSFDFNTRLLFLFDCTSFLKTIRLLEIENNNNICNE